MILNKTNKNNADDLVISSIGACPIFAEEQNTVVIAYNLADGLRICFMTVRPDRKYSYDEFLAAIKQAERVKHVTYGGSSNGRRDIYLCRQSEGRITDVAERDVEYNRFVDGFAEITAAKLKFVLSEELSVQNRRIAAFSPKLTVGTNRYGEDSKEYAVVNACNACLLGEAFGSSELFDIETKNKQRVKVEIRKNKGSYVEEDVLFVKPFEDTDSGEVEYYTSEKFYFIDGVDSSLSANKLQYSNRWKGYIVTRE